MSIADLKQEIERVEKLGYDIRLIPVATNVGGSERYLVSVEKAGLAPAGPTTFVVGS